MKLSDVAWRGHYIMKTYVKDKLRDEMSLEGTAFQQVFRDLINDKNLYEFPKYFLSEDFTNFLLFSFQGNYVHMF